MRTANDGGSTTSPRRSSIAIATLLVAAPLAAQSPQPNLYHRLEVSASLTTIILNANIRVDGANGIGTDLDAEDDLGLATDKLEPRFAMRWRPWPRSSSRSSRRRGPNRMRTICSSCARWTAPGIAS